MFGKEKRNSKDSALEQEIADLHRSADEIAAMAESLY